MILSTGRRVYARQLSQRQHTGTAQDEHRNEPVCQSHRASLGDGQGNSGGYTSPAVANDPARRYGLQRVHLPGSLTRQCEALEAVQIDLLSRPRIAD